MFLDFQTQPDSVNICFDMQQNQHVPKFSISEVFYSRQLCLYNFTIIKIENKQEHNDIHFYTWLGTQAGREANKIGSPLLDYLKKLVEELAGLDTPPPTLRPFSDARASQNKNTVMITCQ